MEEITPTPDPTGFSEKLKTGQEKLIKLLINAVDITQKPAVVATLGWIVQMTQLARIVHLLGQLLTATQESKTQPVSSKWVDAAGIYYVMVVDRGAIYTYLSNGDDYKPVEPSRPADGVIAPVPGILVSSDASRPSEPGYHRVTGEQELIVEAGATRIAISVIAGEVTCDRGDGALVPGVNIVFADPDGLTEITFNGDRDADYVVATQYPIAKIASEPVPADPLPPPAEPITEESIVDMPLMTGDLLPEVTGLAA